MRPINLKINFLRSISRPIVGPEQASQRTSFMFIMENRRSPNLPKRILLDPDQQVSEVEPLVEASRRAG